MARFAQKNTTRFESHGDEYEHGYSFPTDHYSFISRPGLNERVIQELSHIKGEPDWMLKLRLTAYQQFLAKSMPQWGADLSAIDFEKIHYYLKPTDKQAKSWDDVPQDVKETFDRLGIPEAERAVLAGVKAQYDCLTADAKVFTKYGVKNIIDIKSGDEVYSLNEETKCLELQKVLGLAAKGKREVYRVTTQGGREIKVTANHPFWHLKYNKEPGKQRGKYSREWKYLSDLKVGDLVAITTQIPQEGNSYTLIQPNLRRTVVQSRNQFTEYTLDLTNRYADVTLPNVTSEDLMWLFGFFLGDGFFGGKLQNGEYSRVELAIPDKEKQLRETTTELIQKLFGYDLLTTQKDRVILNSQLFVDYFIKNGFSGTAFTKRVPEWVFSLPKAQKLAFIGGYFDADGGIRKAETHRGLVLTSVSQDLLHDFKMLAISCGLNVSQIWQFSSKYVYKGEESKNSGFRLMLSGNTHEVRSKLLRKKELMTARKFTQKFSSANGTVFRTHCSEHIGFARIKTIEKLDEEEVFDIEVSGYHNFVANGIVVHNSEVVYGSLKDVFAKDGVVFLSMDDGLKQYPDLVKEYFGKVIPSGDNKFSALNTAVWSGGSFVYIPKGVEVKMPLQTYFRINSENAGQFERTLIIVDEGAKVHYIEGCTAPQFSSGSLHSAVVEIFVKKGAQCQYTTIQNWYKNVYNLVTKRAYVEEEATMIWTDFNMGSKVTMKYPGFILAGRGAVGETLSMALAGAGQHQDTGSKAIHLAPHTSSTIISKSISKDGGRTSYRGMVNVGPHAKESQNTVICDALLLDDYSRSDTYPVDRIFNSRVAIQHEATVSKIGDDQLFYLMSRGVGEEDARKMVVHGFIDNLVKKLPLEYAVEMNRLIDHEMEGSIG